MGKIGTRVGLQSLMRFLALCSFCSALFAAEVAPPGTGGTSQWGNYYTPFAADSLWNSRPVEPIFGTFVIPKSLYYPAIGSGPYSTGVFLSKDSDTPMIVYGPSGTLGVWDPDAETSHTIIIPHWPAAVLPATGSDGHADIVDPITGMIHSFWQLKQQNGKWVAQQYAWTRLDGRGWGDPAHYFQGARAAAVPASAGLIRKHEINDGQPVYRHALAMSLTFDGLSPSPAYIYPSTSADTGAQAQNSGSIPEGALLMLPPTYNTAQIASLALRKVAETLKLYGAYVVDRNYGTPYFIYVENGSNFKLSNDAWNNAVAAELDRIRASLRQVVSSRSWLDGNGNPMTPQSNFNVLSMRGPWQRTAGTVSGTFDTWTQALVFPFASIRTVQYNATSRGLNGVAWGIRVVGSTQRFTASATGGAKLRLVVRNATGATLFDSGELGNGESTQFVWPNAASILLYAMSGVGQASSVRGDLIAVIP